MNDSLKEDNMNRLDDALQFQQTALGLRAQRQALLASNIANADTPNYKARDINFGAALNNALQGRVGQPLALATTTGRHIGGEGVAVPPNVQYRDETQSSVDGNTVNMDAERAQFAENSVYYEASITFINGLLKTMQLAVTGQ